MTFSQIQPTFSRGEIGPELAARSDLAAYQTGLAKCVNFMVSPYGGVMNRPGTQFLAQTPGNEVARLIRFKFNASDTYALEFTHLKMRVIRNGGYVTYGEKAGHEFVVNGDFTLNIDGWTQLGGAISWDAAKIKLVTVDGIAGRAGQVLYGLVPGETYSYSFILGSNGTFNIGTAAGLNDVLQVIGDGLGLPQTGTFVATQSTHYLNVANFGGTSPGGDITADSVSIKGLYRPSNLGDVFELVTPYTRDELRRLNYTQSADVMDIVHPNHKPAKLKRFDHDDWSIDPVSLVPSIQGPATVTATPDSGTGNSQVWRYQVTAVLDDGSQRIEESLPTSSNDITVHASDLTGRLTWDPVPGATYYNVYKDNAGAGIFGYIGRSTTTSFVDVNIAAVKTDTPPTGDDPFVGAGNYPGAVGYFQQRLCYAGTDLQPQTLWFSRTGVFTNFGFSFPLKDDDSIVWTIASNEVNRVMHITPLRSLMTFTDGAEWIIQGQASGFTPKTINGDAQTYNGIGELRPLVLNNTALYAQERGRTVTAFGYSLEADGFSGSDISVLSPQMLQEYSLVDWDYQQIPYSMIWGAREDGRMVGITYVAEQQVIGWHRHETQGRVLSVCSVPEGRQDAVYLCVEREVGGQTVRYVERMAERQLPRYEGEPIIAYSWFVDSGLRYDGRNQGSTTMTLTGGGEWKYPEVLTLTCSQAQFAPGDVGDSVQYLATPVDSPFRMDIVSYVSSQVVTVRPLGVVPAAIRGQAFSGWAIARDTLSGLSHLEGLDVVALADGNVVSGLTVQGGQIVLDDPAGVVVVGLPYECELQTLEVTAPGAETLSDKAKIVKQVTAVLLESRGGLYGRSNKAGELWEFRPRAETDDYGAIQPITGKATQIITDSWSGNGKLTVVQRDPLPMNILALVPRTDTGGPY